MAPVKPPEAEVSTLSVTWGLRHTVPGIHPRDREEASSQPGQQTQGGGGYDASPQPGQQRLREGVGGAGGQGRTGRGPDGRGAGLRLGAGCPLSPASLPGGGCSAHSLQVLTPLLESRLHPVSTGRVEPGRLPVTGRNVGQGWGGVGAHRVCHSVVCVCVCAKVHLVNSMAFPIVMYGCKSWTIKKAKHQRILVRNPPASAGDTRDVDSIPGLGRSPGVRNGNLFQYSLGFPGPTQGEG